MIKRRFYQMVDMLNDNKAIKVLNYVEEPAVVKDEVIKRSRSSCNYSGKI
jgi:hypothetical protein